VPAFIFFVLKGLLLFSDFFAGCFFLWDFSFLLSRLDSARTFYRKFFFIFSPFSALTVILSVPPPFSRCSVRALDGHVALGLALVRCRRNSFFSGCRSFSPRGLCGPFLVMFFLVYLSDGRVRVTLFLCNFVFVESFCCRRLLRAGFWSTFFFGL